MNNFCFSLAQSIKHDLLKDFVDTQFRVTSKKATIFIEWLNGCSMESVVELVKKKSYKIKSRVIYIDPKKEKQDLSITIIYKRSLIPR